MVRWIKVPKAKPDGLSLIPRIHMVDKENQPLSGCPLTSTRVPQHVLLPQISQSNTKRRKSCPLNTSTCNLYPGSSGFVFVSVSVSSVNSVVHCYQSVKCVTLLEVTI